MLPSLPSDEQPKSRAQYRHAARVINKSAKARAKEYFKTDVDPILNDVRF